MLQTRDNIEVRWLEVVRQKVFHAREQFQDSLDVADVDER
jgi:hypothetical protein